MSGAYEPHWIDKRHIQSREDLLELSQYAYDTWRYADMAEAIRRVVESGRELSLHEQDLFYAAYKKAISEKRFSWQVLTEIIRRTEGCNKEAIAAIEYREQVEEEIRKLCELVQKLIRDYLLPMASGPPSMVFYFKMLADYGRYLCEIIPEEHEEERTEQIKSTIDNYEKAVFHAERHLDVTNHIRLGLFLNYGVFHKEIMKNIDIGTQMIQMAAHRAIEKIDKFEDPVYKDTVVVLQLMRDTITLWLNEQDKAPEDPTEPKEEEKEKDSKSKKSDKSKKDKKSPKSKSPKSKSGSPKKKK